MKVILKMLRKLYQKLDESYIDLKVTHDSYI